MLDNKQKKPVSKPSLTNRHRPGMADTPAITSITQRNNTLTSIGQKQNFSHSAVRTNKFASLNRKIKAKSASPTAPPKAPPRRIDLVR